MKVKNGIELTKDHLKEMFIFKDGATIYDNKNGKEDYRLLLEIEKYDKKLLDIVYDDKLEYVIGKQEMVNEYNQKAICGAILTDKGKELLSKLSYELGIGYEFAEDLDF
jgi:hypothetical protein